MPSPNQIKASANNRGAMIRIPYGNERSARIEVRSVAPDANPYLLLYSLIRAGLESHSGPAHHSRPGTRTVTQAGTTTAATVTTTRTRHTVSRFYTVAAGDSFGVISTKTGVPVATIVRLNPTVSSTSLHVGQRVRIR